MCGGSQDLVQRCSPRREGLLRAVVRSRSRTLLDQMLAAGVDPRDRLTGELRTTLLAREAKARRDVSRLRSRVMLFAPDDPALSTQP